jgi:hypothetical protein
MPALGYRREPPRDADPASPTIEAQGLAIAAECARRQLDLTTMYSEPADGSAYWHALIEDVTPLAGTPDAPTIVLPSLEILAERARDRLLRAMQLHAAGVPILLANGERFTDAITTAWNARPESDRHSDRVREGMQRRALRGFALGRPPYGYRVRDHKLEVEPDEAAVVQEIVRRYLEEGLGVRRLAALHNDRGLVTRQGRPWSATAVRDILRNQTYLGTSRRLGVIVSAAHEPILTRAQFEAVQRKMGERRTAPSEQTRREYLLSGLARCGYCGNRLIGVRRPGAEGELIYYQCESATNQGRCGYHSRRAEDLEAEVRARVARQSADIELRGDTSAMERDRLDQRRRAVQREIDRSLTAWASGELSTQRLLAETARPALEDLVIERDIEALEGEAPAPPPSSGELQRQLLDGWAALGFEEQRALLRRLVSEITVTDDDVRLAMAAGVERRQVSPPPQAAPAPPQAVAEHQRAHDNPSTGSPRRAAV